MPTQDSKLRAKIDDPNWVLPPT